MRISEFKELRRRVLRKFANKLNMPAKMLVWRNGVLCYAVNKVPVPDSPRMIKPQKTSLSLDKRKKK